MFSLNNLKSLSKLSSFYSFTVHRALSNSQLYYFTHRPTHRPREANLNSKPAYELHPEKDPEKFNTERYRLKKMINEMKRDHKFDHQKDPLQEPIQERLKHRHKNRAEQKEEGAEGADLLGFATDVSTKMAEALQESVKIMADVTSYTLKRTVDEAAKLTNPSNVGKSIEKTAETMANTANATFKAVGKMIETVTGPLDTYGPTFDTSGRRIQQGTYTEDRPPAPSSNVQDKDQVEIHDTEEWRRLLDRNTRPIILEFYKGDSQGRRLQSKLGVRGDKRGCLFVSADIDKVSDLAHHMKVHDAPTSLLIHHDKIIFKAEGERDLDELVNKANEILAQQSLYTWY